MEWLLKSVIPRLQWPKPVFKQKRAITSAEHVAMTVFRLYCVEGLTAVKVARRCGCSKALVSLRLKQLREKLGRDPAELRQLSSQFEEVEDSLREPRARRIYRKGAVEAEGSEDLD